MSDDVEVVEAKRGPGRPPKSEEKMFPVRLLKNYHPCGEYKVITAMPPPFVGVHFDHKLWAGTVVELPRSEAVGLIENEIDETIRVRDRSGEMVNQSRKRRFPLAERADDIPI